MKLLIISGSRADYGLLEWPMKVMGDDPYFHMHLLKIWGTTVPEAFAATENLILKDGPDMILVLGDRFEILSAALAAHLNRVPIAHIGGGDVTEGSYDNQMRDCITRLASLHLTTSAQSLRRLVDMDSNSDWSQNLQLVGNPGADYILHGDWKKERPFIKPYVVVSYQPETIDGTIEWGKVMAAVKGRFAVIMRPNKDRGDQDINDYIRMTSFVEYNAVLDYLPHADFLNLLYHSEEFIGNSSAMFYEAPLLGVKTRVIGNRQKGRVIPLNDGKASERIAKAIKDWHG